MTAPRMMPDSIMPRKGLTMGFFGRTAFQFAAFDKAIIVSAQQGIGEDQDIGQPEECFTQMFNFEQVLDGLKMRIKDRISGGQQAGEKDEHRHCQQDAADIGRKFILLLRF